MLSSSSVLKLIKHRTGSLARSRGSSCRRLYSQSGVQRTSISQLAISGSFFLGGLLLGSVYLSKTINSEDEKRIEHFLNDSSTTPLESVGVATYADEGQFRRAMEEIEKLLGKDGVSRNKDVISSVSDSYFSTHHPPDPSVQRPDMVIYPNSTEQVSEVMKILHKYRVPVVAASGLTSLEGHVMQVRGPKSVTLSLERMDQVLKVNADDLDAVLQPGVGWSEFNDYLLDNEETSHLIFGPDPGLGAKLGGMCGTSCSGTNAYRYGTMKENVVNLTVVLADGTIIKTRRRPRKSSAGYDLTRLFIGSEGTLGIITEVTVRLNVRSTNQLVSIVAFPTISDAASTVQDILKTGVQLDAIELVNSTTMKFVNMFGGIIDEDDKPKFFDETPTLLLKVGGPSSSFVDEKLKLIGNIAAKHNVIKLENSTSQEKNEVLWGARRSCLWTTIQYGEQVLQDPKDVQVWTTDIAVPISKLANVVSEVNQDLITAGFDDRFSVLGHVGDGNCHFVIVYNSKDYRRVKKVVDKMVSRALAYDGTCTGEHGVGLGKRKYVLEELGTEAVDLMRHLKLQLDPRRILNPDKIFKLDSSDKWDEEIENGVVEQPHLCS